MGIRRAFGILLAVWVMVLPLLEQSGPPGAAASAAQAQGVFLSVNPVGAAPLAPPRYLIIAPDQFAPALAGYIAAKQAEGYDVIFKTLSQTGSLAAQIRAVILFHSPQFLLLVGDVDLLPAWESRSGLSTPTDLYYATLDGPWDFTPNLAYARLPAHSTAELQAVLAKWADYRTLDGSQAWLSRAAFIAGGAANESAHNDMIKWYTQPAGFSGQFPQDPQPGGDRLYAHTHSADTANLSAALNDGRGLAVYFGPGSRAGWSMPVFTVSHAQSLNGPPLPLLISFAGRTAELSPNHTAFGEAWLLHPTSGALAVIAAGADTTLTADERLEKELFRALFAGLSPSAALGEALNRALQGFSGYYLPTEPLVKQYYEMYSLWGDPTLRLWVDAPRRFSLDLEPPAVSVCGGAAQTLAVEVTLKSAQTPTVTLSLPQPPPGVSGVFSPNPVRSPAVVDLNLRVSADLAAGQYLLTVRGESEEIQQQTGLSLNVRPAAPSGLPLPVLPQNGAIMVSLRPQMSWSAVESADYYEVQIARDANFEQIALSFDGIPQTGFTLSEDLQPGQTYYWRVRAVNGCGAGDFSPAAQFATQPPPGECPQDSRPETLYSQSFEAPPVDWQLENGWQTGNAFGRSGVVTAAAPGEILLQTLTSPNLSLPSTEVRSLILRAETAYDFGDPPACLDGGLLEISTDNGQNWSKLPEESRLTPPYEGRLAVSFGNPRGGEPAWCHRRDWSPLAADLTPYRGQEIRLRFAAATGEDQQSAPGMALDNFEVIACRAEEPVRGLNLTPAHQSVILPAGASHLFIWQLSNTGTQSEQVELTITGSLPVSLPAQSVLLDPAETREIQVEISLPESAVPGEEYIIGLLAQNAGSPSLWAAGELRIAVQRCGLTLAAPSGIPPMARDETSTIFITVTNTGNAADTFHLSAAISPGWQTSLPVSLSVAAAETQGVDLAVRSPADARPGDESLLSITARSAACPSVQQTLERRIAIAGSRLFLPLIGRSAGPP